MNFTEKIVNGNADDRPGQHPEAPGDHALPSLAGVEMAAQRVHIARKPAVHRATRVERPDLLDQQRGNEGKERHGEILTSPLSPPSPARGEGALNPGQKDERDGRLNFLCSRAPSPLA